MKALLIILLVGWAVLSIVGALVEGLLWLSAIALLALVITAIVGWFKLRGVVRRVRDDDGA